MKEHRGEGMVCRRTCMLRVVRFACLLLLFVAASHGGKGGKDASGKEYALVPASDAQLGRTLRVGIYNNPPKLFFDESGRPSGLFVDILAEIASRENWRIVYVPGDWEQCLAALRTGRIDLMPDVAYSRERDLLYDFHGIPVIESWSQVYTRRAMDVSGLAELQGKRVASLRESVQEADFRRMMEGFGYRAEIVPAGSMEDAFRMVRDGEADAAIANHSAGEYLLGKYGLARTDIVFNPVSLFFATASGTHADVLDAIDRRLGEGRRTPDSWYYKALRNWMHESPVQVVPRGLVWLIASIVVFLALSFLAIFFLRRQVKARARHLEMANASLKQQEEKFHRLYNELEMIFEAMPEGLVITDTHRRIQKVNPAFTRIFGYGLDDLAGQSTSILYDSRQGFAEQGRLRYSQDAPANLEPYEELYRRRDGSLFTGETVGGAIRDETGRMIGTLSLVRDVTRHRRMEEDLEQARRMESVGMLAGGVAHDINNTLSAIFGYCEIAMLKAGSASPLQQDLGEILAAAKRSRDITKRLLGFARKQSILPRVLDLNAAVEGLVAILRRLIGENVEFEWKPEGGLWLVKMDPSQIDQILTNLCINARDAIADVGKISIGTRNVRLENEQRLEPGRLVSGEFVLLEVGDDGCGMEKSVLDRVFEPFYTTKAVGLGTGLGLATVHGIVKQNEGFIRVESAPGKGSVFSVYIPRCMDDVSPQPPSESEVLPKGRGETVLVVEDERSILDLSRKILGDLGYHVLGAGSPTEAIRLAETYRGEIEILLTDVVMPGMNGNDLAGRLKQARPDLRVIFMSGHCEDIVAPQERASLVQKPFSIQELAVRIQSTLSARP